MKNVKSFCVLVGIAGISWIVATTDQPLFAQTPPEITSALTQHEQALGQVASTWQVTQSETDNALTPNQIDDFKKEILALFTESLRRHGVTDPQKIRSAAAGAIQNVDQEAKAQNYTTDSVWHIARENQRVLVEGKAAIANARYQYRQLYEGSACLVALDASTVGDQPGPSPYAFVWGAPGDASHYACRLLGKSLDLAPSQLSALAGISPLPMYGAQWTVASFTPQTWVLTSSSEGGPDGPYRLRLTLDRTHGGCLQEVDLTGRVHTEMLQVQSYQQYLGKWVSSKIAYTYSAPRIKTVRQTFTLSSIGPSQSVQIPMLKEIVEDYRLAGTDLGDGPSPTLSKRQAERVVSYQWKGDFPTSTELDKLENNQHPGEALPDPASKASMLPGVGGALCLVGGILLYRRRSGTV